MVEVFGPKGLHCQNTCKFTQEEVTVELPSIQCKPTKIKWGQYIAGALCKTFLPVIVILNYTYILYKYSKEKQLTNWCQTNSA